jgi:WD40 repeat protein
MNLLRSLSPHWKFGLQTLVVLALLALIARGWWKNHRENLSRIQQLERQLARLRESQRSPLIGHFPYRPALILKSCTNAFAAVDDGSLAVCATGVRADVWDLTTGQEMLSLDHPDIVIGLAISPDHRSLATITAGNASPVRFWYLDDGRMQKEYSSPFTEDAQAISATWKMPRETFVSETGFGFTSIAFSPDGRRFAAGCEDGTLIVWDAGTDKEIARMAGTASRIRSMLFSPDGDKLLATSLDKAVQLWDLGSGALISEFRERKPQPALTFPTPLAFLPDGSQFAFFVFQDARTPPNALDGFYMLLRDAETGEDVRRLDDRHHTSVVRQMAFLPDSRTMFTLFLDRLQLRATSTGTILRSHTVTSNLPPTHMPPKIEHAVYLSTLAAVMVVEVEKDASAISIVPFASFQEIPQQP